MDLPETSAQDIGAYITLLDLSSIVATTSRPPFATCPLCFEGCTPEEFGSCGAIISRAQEGDETIGKGKGRVSRLSG
jgi:hypothetical protein